MSTGKKGKSSLPPHNGSEVKYVPKKEKYFTFSALTLSEIQLLFSHPSRRDGHFFHTLKKVVRF